MLDNFIVFILSHGRPDNIKTYRSIRRAGYTGQIRIIIDNLDERRDEYQKKYKDEVIIFDKKKIASSFDNADNFNDHRAVVFARNACFDIAKQLGYQYFIQLDDDYDSFIYRFDQQYRYRKGGRSIRSLDLVFAALLKFFIQSGAHSIAIAQGGDFIGGAESSFAKAVQLKRKAMNSFICSTNRPFQFLGRLNEDVNLYTRAGSIGYLIFTINQVSLDQSQTQANSGGMTDIYLNSGTYVKSFYSVMYHPSSVKIATMGRYQRRLHHLVDWTTTVPKILPEHVKKENGTRIRERDKKWLGQ